MTPEDKVKADIAKAEAAATSATGWIKMHHAWLIGLACLLGGFILAKVV